jgi:hypothetical protein
MTAESGLNDYFYRRDKDRPLPEVLADFHRSHQQLLAALDALGDADLMRPPASDDPDAHPLIESIIGDTYAHYREHRATIEALFRGPG